MPLTRIHGKYMKILMTTTTTGPFSILGGINEAAIPRESERVDTTSFDDGGKTSLRGFDDQDMAFSGFYNLDDTVMKAARLLAGGAWVAFYPNYDADKTKFYAVLGDVQFGYSASATGAQLVTGGKVFARGTAIDNL